MITDHQTKQNFWQPEYKLVLVSQSPRRKALLKQLGIPFTVKVKPGIDETYPKGIKPFEIAEYLARKKAAVYKNDFDDDTLIISADTIVCIDNQILNKPEHAHHAFYMLKQLSERQHEVITGVCLQTNQKTVSFHAITKVFFSPLTNDEIWFYINEYKPFDKAGAYGIQEWIGYTAIKKIEGCFFNVVGLPVQKLYNELKKF